MTASSSELREALHADLLHGEAQLQPSFDVEGHFLVAADQRLLLVLVADGRRVEVGLRDEVIDASDILVAAFAQVAIQNVFAIAESLSRPEAADAGACRKSALIEEQVDQHGNMVALRFAFIVEREEILVLPDELRLVNVWVVLGEAALEQRAAFARVHDLGS